MMNQLDKDAQREVDKQKDEKSIHFLKYLTELKFELEFNNVEQKITEFEELESEITCMKTDRVLRARHYTIYYKTLSGVEDQFNRLEIAFIKLLPKGEWYVEKIRKLELVRKEGARPERGGGI
ncbi:hypothetical protein C5167_033259 [Papaver somniferum]|uniref:Uncharacterized protein n=1 Tax=Papaver somniferum TaxID=3469 RepID=A0A4Y7KBB2_PAPSO|nr:hypothetical protein C5167_033259 [Papaver somniferum]